MIEELNSPDSHIVDPPEDNDHLLVPLKKANNNFREFANKIIHIDPVSFKVDKRSKKHVIENN